MNEKPSRKLSDEQILEQLRAGARRKRPWTPLRVAVTVMFFALPLGLIVWLLIPGPKPPDLDVIAFDQLAVPGEKVQLYAQLLPSGSETERPSLQGWNVLFRPDGLAAKRNEPKPEIAESDAQGVASAWRSAPDRTIPMVFQAEYQSGARKKPTYDRAAVFVYPSDAKLLVVDAESVLPADDVDWKTVNIHDVKPDVKAGDVLKAALAKDYRVVYCAFGRTDAWEYRKLRGWVETQVARRTFPPGPVLGRFPYGAADADTAWASALPSFRKRFNGGIVGLVGKKNVPTAFEKLQIKTTTISDPIP